MRPEHWWFSVPLRLRSLFRRGRVERELDEEMQFHLDELIQDAIARGLPPHEARNAALQQMGGVTQHKESARDVWGVRWLTDFADDFRYAFRSLWRSAGLSVFVVLTLGLGIGMTSGPFSMVDALIFRPYPIPHPGNVVSLNTTTPYSRFDPFSYREYIDVRDHTHSFDGVIANGDFIPIGFSVGAGTTARVRGGALVSGNYFRVLGVEPRLGRGFRPDEDRVPGRDPVVVLGPDFWKREFASDPAIVGRTIRLNGTEFTVIGVAPESFPGMSVFVRPDLYVPLAMARTFSTNPAKNFFEDRDDRELYVKARLKPGVTMAQARNELAALARDFEREYPRLNRNRGAMVRTQLEIRTRGDDPTWKFGVIFTVLALGVLLVACVNVAGLLLSRARTRTREIAVRLALGAGRFRIVRLLLTETLILAALGGVVGISIGYLTIHMLGTFSIPTSLPLVVPFRMDVRLLGASLALSVLSALLCGIAPALQITRVDLVTGLKTADVDLPGRRRLWGRNVLVVAQVSTSLMLLMASFLMMHGFHQALAEGTEFAQLARQHVLMASFDPRLLQYDAARTQRFYDLLLERVRQSPGVVAAGLTQNPPLGLDRYASLAFVPEGYPMPRDREILNATMDTVDDGYFAALEIPIVQGRSFLATDTRSTPLVAIVNEHFAQHYWPGGSAIGRHIRLDGRQGAPVEIVGVSKSIRYVRTTEKPMDFVYLPFAQRPAARMMLLVRSAGGPLQALEPLKNAVRTIDPNLPVVDIKTYEALYRYNAVEGPGIATNIAGVMGLMSLVLAIVGLYGLVAYNVTRRTREIGIRMAVGAQPSDVLRLVLGKGLVLVGAGTIIGLAMGLAVEYVMNTVLFNSGGVDLLTYAIVVPVMFLVTMLAAYVPALRASRIQPTQALRYE